MSNVLDRSGNLQVARAACGHATCTLLGILSLVLADPVGKTHGANVFQKSLDYELYKQRI